MKLDLVIDGMLSTHAKHALFTALSGVPGVRGAEVRLGAASLELDAERGPRGELSPAIEAVLREAVEAAGLRLVSVAVARELPTL